MREETSKVPNNSMEADVKPTTDRIFRRILPGLPSVSMRKIVGGLPVVVSLVAVLDGGEQGSDQVGS